MLSNGTFAAVMVVLIAASHASGALQKEEKMGKEVTQEEREEKEKEKEEEEEDSRLFFGTGSGTDTGSNDGQNLTVTLGSATIFLVGAVVVACVLAMTVVLAVLLLGGRDEATGYGATSSYASVPSYGEETYAVHRSLEEAAKKFS